MENPFYKRATELLRSDQDFLNVVTPEPVIRFLKGPAQAGCLYDRLVRVWGTPGSGKTTLAKLFEYSVLSSLFRDGGIPSQRDLAAAMVECYAVRDGLPVVLGCRLPMESSFRDFWELPYPEPVRFRLMSAFLQAKAVLAWLRALEDAGSPLDTIRPFARAGTESRLASVGQNGTQMQQRARAVEAAHYKVIGSVVPFDLAALPPDVREEYSPFDILATVKAEAGPVAARKELSLQPLVILDDTNVLHPDQYELLKRWLVSREMRIARWMLARFDVLTPEEAFREDDSAPDDRQPGLIPARDILEIRLQSFGPEERRVSQRRAFRTMAKDMASRYLGQIALFSSRKISSMSDILSTETPILPAGKLAELRRRAKARQAELGVTAERRAALEAEIDRYVRVKSDVSEDVRTAMLMILMTRYRKRAGGDSLFPGEDPEPKRPVTANGEVEESAKLHLLHECDRPFYFGPDVLCDAASENAELFLHLAAVLVDAAGNQLSQSQRRAVPVGRQNVLLRSRGEQLLRERSYPLHIQVKRLAHAIGERCHQVTMEPNGWLRPNAYGILQAEFDDLMKRERELAEVLQFGMAYLAWYVKQNASCQGEVWCQIELGGTVILEHGLSLRRGGFVKGTLSELKRWVNETSTALGPRG